MIETTFFVHRKLWPRLETTFGGLFNLLVKFRGEKPFDRGAALRRLQVSARHLLAMLANGQKELRLVLQMRPETGEPLVPHQHQEDRLRHPGRRGRGSSCRHRCSRWRSGDRRGSVWPTPKAYLFERFRGEAFDRIAIRCR